LKSSALSRYPNPATRMSAADADALDSALRTRAFAFLAEQTRLHPNGIPWKVLSDGFTFEGRRVPLLSQQGIFKPALCRLPLSMRTAPIVEGCERPYEDEQDAAGLILYKYRGVDRSHRDNEGLREAMRTRTPLIYLYGLAEGWYSALWPAYVVHDEPAALTFTVEVGLEAALSGPLAGASVETEGESEDTRRWVTRQSVVRLHQKSFRLRVLRAYRERCAICRLGHQELLEAAHILPDRHAQGLAIVPNGMTLCTLHHAAFDSHVLGVSPDLRVEVRTDILEEKDGPMLLHGLQGFHGSRVAHLPASQKLQPRREFLAERYETFKKAG
jgi:putative restriction endonuclease